MSRAICKRALLAVLAVLVGSGLVLGTASPASASATGCARWGEKHIGGVSVPTGQYCFTVNGSGLHVDSTAGSFDTGWIGYPTEIVRFYDTSGNNYASFTTFQGSGTLYGFHFWRTGINGNARTGSVCGELLSSGLTIVRVCEGIRP